MWDILRNKINEAKKMIEEFKSTNSNGKDSIFSKIPSSINKIKPQLNGISGITVKIKNQINQWSSGLKLGLNHVLKYAAALFSLRSIYSTLSSSANSWLSSQNKQAQQLSANIDYMKYALGSVFAGVIQYVTNLVYQLMKAVQSLVYAFGGVNIFAKATASSMKSVAGSAKDTNKSLAGVHNEINNVSENKNSGNGGSSVSPSIDLSKVDNQMSSFAQKLYDFFKPLKDSWDKYGAKLIKQMKTTVNQIIMLISSVWRSFEKIITNGTVYTSLELVLAIIGNIAEAFANAWNYNGNGDAIVQNLANAFNNLLNAINNVVQSEGFQEFLNYCSDKFAIISEKIASINWQPLINALFDIGSSIGTLALDVLTVLVDVFKWLAEHPEVAIAIATIAVKIGILIGVTQTITTLITIFSTVLAFLTSPIAIVVAAILGLIAIIVLCINHWDEIKETVSNVWNKIKEKTSEIVSNIKTTISNWIDNIKQKIANGLNNIKNGWTNTLNSIKTFTTNIFNNIWSTIKGIINSIIGGIEGMANGVTGGVNTVIDSLNGLSFDIPDWVPFFGGKKWSMSIPAVKPVTLPRLKTGSVLYEETAFIGGEYSGARNNPEIIAPQNILKETFTEVLSKNREEQPVTLELTVNVGNEKLGYILLDDLRKMKRQTGKDIEALIN